MARLHAARLAATRAHAARPGREVSRCLRELRLLRKERAGEADVAARAEVEATSAAGEPEQVLAAAARVGLLDQVASMLGVPDRSAGGGVVAAARQPGA